MASGAALPAFTVLGAGSPQSCRQDSHRCGGKRRGRCAHGSLTQGLPYTGLRLGIQIGGDLIQQQHSGLCRCGPCNGQQLPLPLREYPVRTHRVIPLRQRLDGLVDPRTMVSGPSPCTMWRKSLMTA